MFRARLVLGVKSVFHLPSLIILPPLVVIQNIIGSKLDPYQILQALLSKQPLGLELYLTLALTPNMLLLD